jgi:uncharacterized protein YggE
MNRLLIAVLLLAPVTRSLDAQTTVAPAIVEIRTSAQSTAELPAAGASLVVNFSVSKRKPGEAGRANAVKATAIRRALLSLGIPADSLTTRGYSTRLTTNDDRTDTTYVASNEVLVRTSQLALIPRLIDTALAEGATDADELRFWARGADEARLGAMEDATRRARQQADALARAAGGRVGRLLDISTDPPRDRDVVSFSGLGMAASVMQTPIQVPTVSVSVNVYTRWEFIPNSP